MRTLDDIAGAIEAVIADNRRKAERSPYDWKVCVMAVAAAADRFNGVPRIGPPEDYLAAVIASLADLRDNYYDGDGEFTAGVAEIGSVVADIARMR
jgi:hypothetical protein